MRILIVGGTSFSGRALSALAAEAGHDVTLFHRGETNPDHLAGRATHVLGDRTKHGDLEPLRGRSFDAVIDTCAYHPRHAALLLDAVEAGTWCLYSSISAYASNQQPGFDESASLRRFDGPPPDEVVMERYGELKTACEDEVLTRCGDRALIVRPGLIVGPHDPTDRFTYWVERAARGGTILAPGNPGRQVQLIDARDLAAWILAMVETGRTGAFTATGPADPLTMSDLIAACLEAAGTTARVEWLPDPWLLERGVEPWSELPLWLPEGFEDASMLQAGNAAAIREGLTFRPLVETARDTLEWSGRRDAQPRKAGMTEEREAELLREAGRTPGA